MGAGKDLHPGKLSLPSQKWRAFPQTSAERFTFLPAFESNVPFLGAMSQHPRKLNSGSQDCKTSHCEVLLPRIAA